MSPSTPPNSPDSPQTAGARWVDRYFVPRIAENMGGRTLNGLRILQLEPRDADEALRCQECGARVTFASLVSTGELVGTFPSVPINPDGTLGAPDGAFDVLLTGRLGHLVGHVSDPARFLAECARVCAPGGGMLASLATGCPLSLAGGACDLARRHHTVSIDALARAFGSAHLLPVHGHFGWRAGSGARRMIGKALDAHWRTLASPSHPRIYKSPLNPLMIIWASKT